MSLKQSASNIPAKAEMKPQVKKSVPQRDGLKKKAQAIAKRFG